MLKRIYFIFLVLFGMTLGGQAAVPNVVVTIKPIYSLVAGVMAGLKTPILLMSGERSPHTQSLTPTEVRQINAAQVVVWVGPSYEASLQGIIGSSRIDQHVITLLDKPGMILYPVRQGGVWGSHNHTHEKENSHTTSDCLGHNHHQLIDGHLWLDPDNAKAIVRVIAGDLAILDPKHEEEYKANAEIVISRLEDLDRELELLLIPVIDKPYVIYHDGTQYFDRHFKTKAIGVLIGDGHYGINAQHFLKVAEFIRDQKVNCVFTEPQFPTDKIHSLLDKTGIRIETLDYLGVGLTADKNAYFSMMRNLANGFLRGLGGVEENPNR